MQKIKLYGAVLLLIFGLTLMIKPGAAVETLTPDDFKLQSFSKTVDFFDFARAYAAALGKTPPPSNWHAYLYQNYINTSGFQLFYSGLINITAGQGALTIPVQSFLEHYKTPNGKDVLTSSSFIMLLAFNDTATSLHDDSPDINDNLYASFSLGFDLTNITGTSKPSLSSKTDVIPLTHPDDNTWEWGMRYTDLTAIWWRMFINPLTPRYEALPIAITTYEELTFTYKLVLNPDNNTATVTSNYVIGRMTNLWLVGWLLLVPIVVHYNATGAYTPRGVKLSDETIYQFLDTQHIKMSIVLFQNSLVLDQVTESTFNNQDVTDAEVDVSNGAISTESAGETIFKADFGVKEQYKLYNLTSGNTEEPYAVTRTVPRLGFARNPLFAMHVGLLKYVPLIVKHIDPPLYEKAKDHMLNMTYADYFYVISYPKYSGFRIEHDPTYTAYASLEAAAPATTAPRIFGLVLLGAIIVVVVIGSMFFMRRRKPRTQASGTSAPLAPPAPPAPPTPPTATPS
jgi:hypothetical protein